MASTRKLSSTAAIRFEGVATIGQLIRLFFLWNHRVRSRRALARLEPRLLSDIGIDRLDAAEEARKHFWQA